MPIFKYNYLHKDLIIKVDEVARRSETSVWIEYDDSIVLATVCYKIPEELQTDFLPLTVQVNDNLYSKQRIPGSYNRRDNRPSLSSTLTSRIIDRSMRPLFDPYFFGETQLLINPIGIKIASEPTFVSFLAASIALAVSTIPFRYAVAGLKFAIIDDKLILNPSIAEQQKALSKGFVAYTNGKFVMIDAEFNEMENALVMSHLKQLIPELEKLVLIIKSVQEQIKKEKLDFRKFSFAPEIISLFTTKKSKFINILNNEPKNDKESLINNELKEIEKTVLLNKSSEEVAILKNEMALYKEDYFRSLLVEYYTQTSKRFDERTATELRSISGNVNLIKQSHGSGYFIRGETEVLSIVVLDSLDRKLHANDIWHNLDHDDTFFLHYSFPAFAVGETYRIGPPKRRELGHGALAEKAIRKVLLNGEDNYTLRINCEVLSSNGSSSQASICATSLALYDAGIKTKGHISGIAIGLLTKENGDKIILTDIEGWEDHYGEMDFKVAHTRKGVCSIQLDLKNDGIELATIYDVLKQGEQANTEILNLLYSILPVHRKEYKDNVLKIVTLKLPEGKTGALIGPGGKNIKKIIADNEGLQLSVDNDVAVIYHQDINVVNKVVHQIESSLGIIKYNVEVNAPIVRIEDYGIFVEVNNVWALIHHTKLPPLAKKKGLRNFYKINQIIKIIPFARDEKGRLQVRLKS